MDKLNLDYNKKKLTYFSCNYAEKIANFPVCIKENSNIKFEI